MNDQQRQDLAFVAEVMGRYQKEKAHGEMVIKIQDGRVVLVEENRKHKPRTRAA